jgi:hypothetical protein
MQTLPRQIPPLQQSVEVTHGALTSGGEQLQMSGELETPQTPLQQSPPVWHPAPNVPQAPLSQRNRPSGTCLQAPKKQSAFPREGLHCVPKVVLQHVPVSPLPAPINAPSLPQLPNGAH